MVRKSILFLFLIFIIIAIISFVSSVSCWEHSVEAACGDETDYNCRWNEESWGGWCEELNCYSLWAQTDCDNATLHTEIGRDCQWKSPDSSWDGVNKQHVGVFNIQINLLVKIIL